MGLRTQFLHGAEVLQIDTGSRPITTPSSAVIGLIGSAPFGPLNTPTLISGSQAVATTTFGPAGYGFTIPDAIAAMSRLGGQLSAALDQLAALGGQLAAAGDPEAAEAQVEAVRAQAAAQVEQARAETAAQALGRHAAGMDAAEARAAAARPSPRWKPRPPHASTLTSGPVTPIVPCTTNAWPPQPGSPKRRKPSPLPAPSVTPP